MFFLKQFFKSIKYTGAIAPSSSFLAKQMINDSNVFNANTIVELGPGTGAITDFILTNMADDASLWTFDINKEFCAILQKKYKGKHINADIIEIKDILSKEGIESVDCIISGIPFGNFSDNDCIMMLNEIKKIMHDDTLFTLFTYSPLKFNVFNSVFKQVKKSFVLFNIPPAYVLTFKKK